MKKRFKAELVDSIFVDENKVEHELTKEGVVFDAEKTVSYAVADEDVVDELVMLLNKMYDLLVQAEHDLTTANGLYASDKFELKEVFRLNYSEILNNKRV